MERAHHQRANDVEMTLEDDSGSQALDHGHKSLNPPEESSSQGLPLSSNALETSVVVLADNDEFEQDGEAKDNNTHDVQCTTEGEIDDEDTKDDNSGYESSDEQTVDEEEEVVHVDNQFVRKPDAEDDEKKSEDEEEEDPLEDFRPVLAELDRNKLQQAALLVRLDQLQTQTGQHFQLKRLLDMSCQVDPDPMHGAYNLVYRITFSDGTIWAARIPGHGTQKRFKDLDAKKMDCEYWTMRHIKSKTSVPMPEVYYWETSHRIGTPFAFMSWIKGQPLFRVWDSGLPNQQRLAILSSVAGYMSQFHQLSFDRLGMLNFDSEGNIEKIGGEIVLESLGFVTWSETKEYKPHATLLAALRSMMDEAEKEDMHESHRSELPLLRLAVESVPDYLAKENRFALHPADFNLQNILCDPENKYQLTGFIDWDGVHAEASSAGYAQYPSWITRDWDPALYDYDSDNDPDTPEPAEAGEEDSPAVLSKYRQHYATEFAKLAADFDGYDPRMTTQSHIMEALCIALTNGFCRGPIIDKLLEHAFNGTPPFDASEYLADFEVGNTAEKDAMVKQAFTNLWHAEWEKPTQIKDDCELSDTDSLMTVTTADSNSDTSSDMSSQEDEQVEQFCEIVKGPDLMSMSQEEEQYPQVLNLQGPQHFVPTEHQPPPQMFGRSTPAELESPKNGKSSKYSKSQRRKRTWDEELRQKLTQLDSETLESGSTTSA